jgi:hypothetical protein
VTARQAFLQPCSWIRDRQSLYCSRNLVDRRATAPIHLSRFVSSEAKNIATSGTVGEKIVGRCLFGPKGRKQELRGRFRHFFLEFSVTYCPILVQAYYVKFVFLNCLSTSMSSKIFIAPFLNEDLTFRGYEMPRSTNFYMSFCYLVCEPYIVSRIHNDIFNLCCVRLFHATSPPTTISIAEFPTASFWNAS